ncbi:outer membrane protein assembly factor BamA [Bacteriovorax sp. Seq25_V]|uniref:outer membrane protein assembly factor BamA n=1 Tax=Bacteriovorax sp. Seq25_V TaxID=1201288 RepID=UPI00038A17A1|nr:outer membrane protein assembly factor BamA [Bacteriovorax sp. Seq25_V]EQC47275.1 outer membrane protein assembly complex, YaeT protein [Bacteriovorax sp. Seq25_V]
MNNSLMSSIIISFFLSLNSLVFAMELGPEKDLFKVSDIKIQGLKKVEKEAVLERISTKKGQELTNYSLKKDIEKIYNLKYFDSVEAHQEGSVLIFKVKEKPIIAKIVFEGNDEVSKDDLTGQIKSKEYSILDINTIKTDVKAMQKFYEEKGFYLASVNYELRKVDDENVDLVFKVDEFEKVRVKKISFLGTQAFSDNELKGLMETREESLFSFMSGSGNFKEFGFRTDIERIKYFYRTKGYLQINIGTPDVTVSEDKKWVFVTVKVNEGPKFSIRDISFQGEVLFPDTELMEKIKLKNGDVYSEELLRNDVQTLTELYQDQGYAFANVIRNLNVVPGENKVDVDFSFEKGKIAYFGKISVKGNTKSRDKVIRRELKIKEGARFTGTGLRESKENVNRLGFFEPGSVVFNTISPPGKDDVLDVEITVKEKSTGQISLGAGYSTQTGGFFQASITQNNFRGMGQQLSFSTSLSKNQKSFSLSFTEPYFLDTKWTAGGEVFKNENKELSSYDYKKEGFALRVGYPIFDYTRLFTTYKLEETTLENIEDETIDEEAENGLTSSVRLALVTDKRNHRFEPTDGYYINIATEYAGVGGEKKWLKNEFDSRYFKSIWGDLVFRSRFYTSKLEVVEGQKIPRNEKFSLGGARNLRGFNIQDIGPKKIVLVDADDDGLKNDEKEFNSGALFTAYTTFEFEHPLAREAGLKWVVFYDAGTAADFKDIGKIYMDYGFGFRWFSPIGVLRFEFGFPINPDSGEDDGSKFHFDIGQLF